MAIHFECPHCKEGLRAPEKAVGKTAKCSRCNKKVLVPEKKEVLVPGKDGVPKKISKLESKTKPEHKGGKGKSKIKKDVAELDSEIDKKLKKGKLESKSSSEKDVNEFESELERELEEETKAKSESKIKSEKDGGLEKNEKSPPKSHKEEEGPQIKLKPESQKDTKEMSQEELLKLEKEVDKKIEKDEKSKA